MTDHPAIPRPDDPKAHVAGPPDFEATTAPDPGRVRDLPPRSPRRIQRRRTKGWSMPKTAVYVGRGTPFGNGWRIGDPDPDDGHLMTRDDVYDRYAASLTGAAPETLAIIRERLAGRDLACWCRLDQKCHADLLLVVANDPAPLDAGDDEDDLIDVSLTMLADEGDA